MFDRIAGVYDLMNTAMTAGMHHRWRERAADRAELAPGDAALDLCCGTGDLALELARRVGAGGQLWWAATSRSGCWSWRGARPAERGASQARFEWADALELPYPEGSFDAVTVGFGVRNLVDLERGLAEMARVLKPGGRAVILEITQPRRRPLSTFYSLWFDRLVPLLGAAAGDRDAYSVPARVGEALPAARGPGGDDGRRPAGADSLPAAGRRDHRDPLGGERRGEPDRRSSPGDAGAGGSRRVAARPHGGGRGAPRAIGGGPRRGSRRRRGRDAGRRRKAPAPDAGPAQRRAARGRGRDPRRDRDRARPHGDPRP